MLDGTEQCEEDKDDFCIVRSLDSLQEVDFYRLLHHVPQSDVTIVVGGRKYHVLKCVLQARSDVFQAMFSPSSIWEEASSKQAKLVECSICESVFPEFIQFMYSGSVNLKYDTVLPLFILSDKYNVKELISICSNYVTKHMVLASRENTLLDWYRFLHRSKHQDLADKIHRFIRLNFSRFAQTEDFLQLEFEELLGFLECSDLKVADETEIFHLVESWIEGEHFSEQQLTKLTEAIRFPLMSTSEILILLLNTDLFRKLPNVMLRHHEFNNCYYQGCDFRDKKTDRGTSIKVFQPRLYFGNKYGALKWFPLFTIGGNVSEETLRLSSTDDIFIDERKECIIKLTFNNWIGRRMDITVNLLNGDQVGYNFDLAILFYAKQDGDLYVYNYEKYHLAPCMGYKVIKDVGLLHNKISSIDDQKRFLCGKNFDQLLLRFIVIKTPTKKKYDKSTASFDI